MEKIQINNFKEIVYYERLDNGFEVYLVPLKNKKNFFTTLGVKYGGRDINFSINDKKYKVPTGIAHFLEHKMFEKEDNPFSFYQKTGTSVNASTSYDFTRYYIIGNKMYKKNLRYLLKWLKNLSITDEQVEKEKGIILEEANMYKDNPDIILMEHLNKNVFVNDPYNTKVIGTDDDIKRIKREEIELCYDTFYTADNMFLISVGNFDVKDAIEIIKEDVKDYKVCSCKIDRFYGDEPLNVSKEFELIHANVDIPRIASAYKIDKSIFKNLGISNFELDLYLHILIDISLGVTSDIRNTWLSNNLFIEASYRIMESLSYYVIEFLAISNNPDKLKIELDKYLNNLIIDKDTFERQKKIWISGEVKNSNNIEGICYSILDDILDYNSYISNKIEIIRKLDYSVLKKIKELISFDSNSTVKVVSNK